MSWDRLHQTLAILAHSGMIFYYARAGKFSEPSVSRVDLRVSHDVRSVRLQGDLLNAFNARYNELGYVLTDFKGQPTPLRFPAPGRALRFGATWTF